MTAIARRRMSALATPRRPARRAPPRGARPAGSPPASASAAASSGLRSRQRRGADAAPPGGAAVARSRRPRPVERRPRRRRRERRRRRPRVVGDDRATSGGRSLASPPPPRRRRRRRRDEDRAAFRRLAGSTRCAPRARQVSIASGQSGRRAAVTTGRLPGFRGRRNRRRAPMARVEATNRRRRACAGWGGAISATKAAEGGSPTCARPGRARALGPERRT